MRGRSGRSSRLLRWLGLGERSCRTGLISAALKSSTTEIFGMPQAPFERGQADSNHGEDEGRSHCTEAGPENRGINFPNVAEPNNYCDNGRNHRELQER